MTRIGIYGYGNLGRGVEAAINQNDDMELVAVFTRRNPDELVIKNQTAKVCNVKDMADWKDKNRCYDSVRRNAQRSSGADHRNVQNIST